MAKKYALLLISFSFFACGDSNSHVDMSNTGGSDAAGLDLIVNDDAGTKKDLNRDNQDLGESDASSDVQHVPDLDEGVFGGERPAAIVLPSDYDSSKSYPLITLLHGYTSSGQELGNYLGVEKYVDILQFILILPDGLIDGRGNRYWNATEACCAFGGTKPNDGEYLIGLVDEAIRKYNVDEKKVYFTGHSNGGFMSYTMACEYGDRIAAIASLSGTTYSDPTQCPDTGDVSVLHVHGTSDTTIRFNGGRLVSPYPGAQETTTRWALRNDCSIAQEGGTLDLIDRLAGEETSVQNWTGCANNTEVKFWTVNGGPHSPAVNTTFVEGVLGFLLSHSK